MSTRWKSVVQKNKYLKQLATQKSTIFCSSSAEDYKDKKGHEWLNQIRCQSCWQYPRKYYGKSIWTEWGVNTD